MTKPKVSQSHQPKKPTQQSTIANHKFREKVKEAVEAYEAAVNKAQKTFTFTEEEFEELGILSAAVFELQESPILGMARGSTTPRHGGPRLGPPLV